MNTGKCILIGGGIASLIVMLLSIFAPLGNEPDATFTYMSLYAGIIMLGVAFK